MDPAVYTGDDCSRYTGVNLFDFELFLRARPGRTRIPEESFAEGMGLQRLGANFLGVAPTARQRPLAPRVIQPSSPFMSRLIGRPTVQVTNEPQRIELSRFGFSRAQWWTILVASVMVAEIWFVFAVRLGEGGTLLFAVSVPGVMFILMTRRPSARLLFRIDALEVHMQRGLCSGVPCTSARLSTASTLSRSTGLATARCATSA
ncbi:MAG: hypothetical protein L0H22_12120, partial [Brevibacterium aurantiacum]|nr:hypothetical protein [Brevibacterium aurantiacum]